MLTRPPRLPHPVTLEALRGERFVLSRKEKDQTPGVGSWNQIDKSQTTFFFPIAAHHYFDQPVNARLQSLLTFGHHQVR